MEYWVESEDDLKNDCDSELEPTQDNLDQQNLNSEQESAIWWIVAFTCILQTLHSLPLQSVEFLLKFFAGLLTFLGKYSIKIAEIANALPRSLHTRSKYLGEKLFIAPLITRVVCVRCHTLYKYAECTEVRQHIVYVKHCSTCKCRNPLLREIVTSAGNKRFYPYSMYPYCSLIDTLKAFFHRPGFMELCGRWHDNLDLNSGTFSDVYSGRIWKEFMHYDGLEFLSNRSNIAFMMNIDWYQPYKHRTYSVGVIYLVFMNLPRNIRFKRENVILLGLIPGPSEPALNINSYLTPIVSDLLSLWKGVSFRMEDNTTRNVRGALLCIACDLPAGRKVCGFLSHAANLGCSKCYSTFSTGIFGKQCYAGFDRDTWVARTNEKHRRDVCEVRKSETKTERQRREREYGCRYSCLLQLPYFDPVRMLILDPMHNMYLGTAKYIINRIWIKNGILSNSALKEINCRISSITVPPNVTFSKLPPRMEHTSSFTAEQMMVWVNYYSLFCLYNVLPEDHYECWRHFVLASRLLSKKCLSTNDISVADKFLLLFCRRIQILYGEDVVTPNMHMHAHLADCILDFGPMSSFWLFSFERFNGILGDQPTNNRSIEVQLMKRFMVDNSHVHLVTMAKESNIVIDHIVRQHSFSFHSMRHLDNYATPPYQPSSVDNFVPAIKYTLALFSSSDTKVLLDVYSFLYPEQVEHFNHSDFVLPSSYKKMVSVTIQGQKFTSGECVLARSVFPVCSHTQSSPATIFFDPTLHAAKIEYFAVHSFHFNDLCITRPFAVVQWFLCHPNRHKLGRPLQVWHPVHEQSPQSILIPVEYISCPLLTVTLEMERQPVLVILPTM